jgi:hypothetical protein
MKKGTQQKFKANQFVKGGRRRGTPKKQKGGRKTK